jgi:hypothetical protein
MAHLPAPGRTGVRIAGDIYQWAIGWQGCVTLLRDHVARASNPVIEVGVEVDGAGNLDDVVLRRQTPPHTYTQVKYAVDSSSPVNETYLLQSTTAAGRSILRKISEAWRHLSDVGAPVDLELVTNRAPDPSDPLVSLRDSRTGLLMPKAGFQTSSSARGAARIRWATGTGLTVDDLLQMLSVLRFDLARDPTHLHEVVSLQMLAAGLRHDDTAVHAGADWVARQVRDGHQTLDFAAVQQAVETLRLRAGPPRTVVSIATLKPDPAAQDADYKIDWVERFDGRSAFLKRRPKPPATWAELQAEVEAIPDHLPSGSAAVALTGSFRQATAFLVGSALRMVTGVDLAVNQRGQLWSTATHYQHPITPQAEEHQLGQGTDLAIAIAIATDPTKDVLDFIRAHNLTAERLLVLNPAGGPRDTAVPDAAAANALAVGLRDTARRASTSNSRIHLFLAGPMGLALLLGHRWNRLRPTVVYEDVQGPQNYEAAFTIDA